MSGSKVPGRRARQNRVGGFVGGILGILVCAVTPKLIPFGCLVGVALGFYHLEVADALGRGINWMLRRSAAPITWLLRAIGSISARSGKRGRRIADGVAGLRASARVRHEFHSDLEPQARLARKLVSAVLFIVVIIPTFILWWKYGLGHFASALDPLGSFYFGPWLVAMLSPLPGFVAVVIVMSSFTGAMVMTFHLEPHHRPSFPDHPKFDGLRGLEEALAKLETMRSRYAILEVYSKHGILFGFLTDICRLAINFVLSLLLLTLTLLAVTGIVIPTGAVALGILIAVGVIRGTIALTRRTDHWLCLSVTLVVTASIAWFARGLFQSMWLWLVALVAGTLSGQGAELAGRLLIVAEQKKASPILWAADPVKDRILCLWGLANKRMKGISEWLFMHWPYVKPA